MRLLPREEKFFVYFNEHVKPSVSHQIRNLEEQADGIIHAIPHC